MENERTTYRECGQVIVVYARDYLNDIEGEKIEDLCESFLRERVRGIILDFSNTSLINSIGVSILTGIIEKVRGVGARVSFSGLRGAPYDVLRIVGLTESVAVYESEEEALRSEGPKVRGMAL